MTHDTEHDQRLAMPDDWDLDYKQLWQRLQNTQDRLRGSRAMLKAVEKTLEKADAVINTLYESGRLNDEMRRVVQDYLDDL